MLNKLPYSKTDDYNESQAEARRSTVEEATGQQFQHLNKYSFDPKVTAGNIENLSGVAQVPIGFAGPLLVNGENAKGYPH